MAEGGNLMAGKRGVVFGVANKRSIAWGITKAVTDQGAEVALTPKEFDLLAELATDPGAVFTRDHLISHVWDEHFWGSTKTLDVHVASLRKKIGPERIETVRGVGFSLAHQDVPR